MEIEKALQEDRDGDNAAGQNRPHEQPALLDVINHEGYLLSVFLGSGQATATSATERVTRPRRSVGRRRRRSRNQFPVGVEDGITDLLSSRAVFINHLV